MLSLYVRPLTFDNKKNEILFSQYNIEWKKQVSTVSFKKGLTIEAFMNEKILPKVGTNAYVFGRFKYISEDEHIKDIFLVCNENKSTTSTELYFESHIPVSESVTILESHKQNITKTAKNIKIKGEALAFCIDVVSYYLEDINLDEYIEFVQADPLDVANANMEVDSNSEEEEDVCDSEEDESDDDIEDIDDLEDDIKEGEDAEEEGEDVDDIDEVEDEVDDVEDDDEDEVDDDEDDDEVEVEVEEEEEEEAVDDENGIPVTEDLGDGDEDEAPILKASNKRKKTGSSKSIKFSTGIDMSVIFNILKAEDRTKIIPESQLHLKRQINLKIFKLLDLPFKTIQMIEKGIYNYVIEKYF